jgi:hypothetical protein
MMEPTLSMMVNYDRGTSEYVGNKRCCASLSTDSSISF